MNKFAGSVLRIRVRAWAFALRKKLVAEPELHIKAVLQQLGLQWESGCLEFHHNDTAVNTASVSQVRQKIYGTSVEKWRKFDDQLGPLRAALHSQ